MICEHSCGRDRHLTYHLKHHKKKSKKISNDHELKQSDPIEDRIEPCITLDLLFLNALFFFFSFVCILRL